jgi:hypothetical protein
MSFKLETDLFSRVSGEIEIQQTLMYISATVPVASFYTQDRSSHQAYTHQKQVQGSRYCPDFCLNIFRVTSHNGMKSQISEGSSSVEVLLLSFFSSRTWVFPSATPNSAVPISSVATPIPVAGWI